MKKKGSYIIQSSDNIQELEDHEIIKVRAVSDYDIRQIILKYLRYSESQADFCRQFGIKPTYAMRLSVYLLIPDSDYPRASDSIYKAVCKAVGLEPYVEIQRLARGCKMGSSETRALNYGIPMDKFISKYCEIDPNGVICMEDLFRAYAITVSKETDMLYVNKWTMFIALRKRFDISGYKLPSAKTITMLRGIRFNALGMKTFHYWGYQDTEKTILADEIVHEFVYKYCEVGVQYSAKGDLIRNAWHTFLKELNQNNQTTVPADSPVNKMLGRFYGTVSNGMTYYGIRLKGYPNARDPYKINAELLPKHYADKLIEWRYQHPQVLRNFVDEKKNSHREVAESVSSDSSVV